MADQENPPVVSLGAIVAVFLILSAIGFYIDKYGILDTFEKANDVGISGSLPSGSLAVGEEVVNKTEARVRRSIAGSLIGTQDKLKMGKIIQGPVESFGTLWWMIDYEDAPDGWVSQEDITNKVGLTRLVNIGPIIYSFILPIAIGLLIIAVLLIFFVKGKTRKVKKLIDNQKELNNRVFYNPLVEPIEPLLESGEEEEVLNVAEEKELTSSSLKAEDLISDNSSSRSFNPLDLPGAIPVGNSMPAYSENREVETQVSNNGIKDDWSHIEQLMNSNSQNDWKQAIMEADIILSDMLDRMGIEGTTIGEKMKKIDRSDFVTLNNAWEAHRVRNNIAHEPRFDLDKNLAKKTIENYRKVFGEFYLI